MRRLVLFCALVAGLCVAAPALAQTEDESPFPDLPGMGLAHEAARGEVAPSQSTQHDDTGSGAANTGTDLPAPTAEPSTEAEPPDAGAIADLPGTGGIPVIGDVKVGLAVARQDGDGMPRGLAAAAALGTILSVGAFLLFRDRLAD